MSKFPERMIGLALASMLCAAPALAEKIGLGRPALPEEIAAWDLDVRPDGLGLPEGSGDVATGEEVFSEKCAVCHGEFAEGVDNWPKLAGGRDTLNRDDPLKTVGSYWPYLSTTWDYVHRSMPFGNAQTLAPDGVYAIVAYILYSNDLVEDDFVLSKETFLDVAMPNADGLFVDDRDATELAAFSAPPCMENCKATVEITAHATVLDVTPDTQDDNDPVPVVAAEPEAPVETPVAEAPAPEPAPAPAAAEPAAAAVPDLVSAGEKVFKKCAACHKVGDKAKNSTGPMMNGIVGRSAATVEGFKYSPAMTKAAADGLVWDAASIDAYLLDPKGFVPKNKMSFVGLKKPEDRAAVIAYLSTFGG
ncbi:c-type cytochrome [Paracoccaceae bacterium Fryx2]|nr:c-type cytochrome [Paracoccaceae bacterium Fryx2]